MEKDLIKALISLDEERVYGQVRALLAAGKDPLAVVDLLRQGVTEIGDRFATGDVFITELIMAGDIVHNAAEIIKPALTGGAGKAAKSLGRVVLGTVKGDVHDIGLNIIATLFEVSGFQVHNLGVDVPASAFVDKIKQVRPEIVGLSGLLTVSQGSMIETVAAIKKAGLREGLTILVGGAIVSEDWVAKTGADYYCRDAAQGVKAAKRALGVA